MKTILSVLALLSGTVSLAFDGKYKCTQTDKSGVVVEQKVVDLSKGEAAFFKKFSPLQARVIDLNFIPPSGNIIKYIMVDIFDINDLDSDPKSSRSKFGSHATADWGSSLEVADGNNRIQISCKPM